MVDAGAIAEAMRKTKAVEPRPLNQRAPLSPVVVSGAAALNTYSLLCRDAVLAPAQSAIWAESWARNCHADFLVAALEADGHAVFALALEVVSRGPFRIARFCGGPHANGNFPAGTRNYLASAQPDDLATLKAEIHGERPDIDVLLLERQVETVTGYTNPLSRLPRMRSPNIALAANLEGGFDGLLSRINGARKRKKHRYQLRKFEAAGGFRRIEATNPIEVDRLLTAFFSMKEERFRKMGVVDVFAPDEVRSFFRDLFTNALRDKSRPFVLHGLLVGDKIRAVTGSSRCGERLICDFTGFAEDEMAQYGPGEFLLFENIRDACNQGLLVHDLSVGDEPYKRCWCDMETEHFDTILPLTAKGRLLAATMRRISHAKLAVKRSPTLWNFAKQLRKLSRIRHSQEEQE